MSKKKHNSIFSVEDQMRAADEFYEMQIGKKKITDIMDLHPENKTKIGKNGLTKELSQLIGGEKDDSKDSFMEALEHACLAGTGVPSNIMPADKEEQEALGHQLENKIQQEVFEKLNAAFPEATSPLAPTHKPATRPVQNVAKPQPQQRPVTTRDQIEIRKITFTEVAGTDIIVINDGLVPNGFDYTVGQHSDGKLYGTYDADELAEMAINCIQYAIVSKHPSAVFRKEDFVQNVTCVNGYNTARFIFMVSPSGNYVFGYYVDTESFDNAVRLMRDGARTVEEFVINTLSLVEAVDNHHNAFYYEDDESIERFMRAWSDANMQSDFIDVLFDDPDTQMLDDDNDIGYFPTYEISSLATIVRAFINAVTGTEQYDMGYDFYNDLEDGEDPGDEETDEPANEGEDTNEQPSEPVRESAIKVVHAQSAPEVPADPIDDVSDEDLLGDGVEMVAPDAENASMTLEVTHKKGTREA